MSHNLESNFRNSQFDGLFLVISQHDKWFKGTNAAGVQKTSDSWSVCWGSRAALIYFQQQMPTRNRWKLEIEKAGEKRGTNYTVLQQMAHGQVFVGRFSNILSETSWVHCIKNCHTNQGSMPTDATEKHNLLGEKPSYKMCQWCSDGRFSLIFSSLLSISRKEGLWFISAAQHWSVNLQNLITQILNIRWCIENVSQAKWSKVEGCKTSGGIKKNQ